MNAIKHRKRPPLPDQRSTRAAKVADLPSETVDAIQSADLSHLLAD